MELRKPQVGVCIPQYAVARHIMNVDSHGFFGLMDIIITKSCDASFVSYSLFMISDIIQAVVEALSPQNPKMLQNKKNS